MEDLAARVEELRAQRQLVVSQRCRPRFLGYLRSQRERAVRGAGGFRVVDTAGADLPATAGTVSFGNLKLQVEPLAEWKQMYWDAWRLLRDYFYVANMHGGDISRSKAHHITCPALLIAGEDDPFASPALVAQLAARINNVTMVEAKLSPPFLRRSCARLRSQLPQMRVVTLDAAGHHVTLDARDELLALLRETANQNRNARDRAQRVAPRRSSGRP